MKSALIFVILVLLVKIETGYCEVLNVDIQCKGGKCVPNQGQQNKDLENRVNRIAMKYDRLKNSMNQNAQNFDELQNLMVEMKEVKMDLRRLNREFVRNYQWLDELNRKINLLEQNMVKMCKEFLLDINKQKEEMNEKMLVLEQKLMNHLELSPYGLLVYHFGLNTGGMLKVSLPFDEWKVNFGVGVGLDNKDGVNSLGLGWLLNLSVLTNVSKMFSLGPSLVFVRDEGDLLTPGNKKWFAGLGVDFKIQVNKWFSVNLNPYLGVTPNTGNNTYYVPEYVKTSCGWVFTGEYLERFSYEKKYLFDGGGMASLNFQVL